MILRKTSKLLTGALALLLVAASPHTARAFTHPGLPTTLSELDNIKAKIDANVEPWKSAYTALANDPHSDSQVKIYGPFVEVGRTPDVNRAQYVSDMLCVYNLALMWRLTGLEKYSIRGVEILDGYATKHTLWSGAESYLTTGDALNFVAQGADILRASPAWTPTVDTHVKNYFANMIWPQSGLPTQLRSANQGAIQLAIGMAAAVFCDDVPRFTQILDAFRNEPCTGLNVILSNGQVGDSGRDQGHTWGELSSYTWVAEVAWKQGVDLYGEKNNALLQVVEYYSKYNLGLGQTFLQAGPCYDLYFTMGGAPAMSASPDVHYRAQNHYVNRKGLAAPYTTQWLNTSTNTVNNSIPWKFAGGPQPAVPPTAAVPATLIAPPAATALTNTTLGTVNVVGSASYSGGTWTISGSGTSLMQAADSGHFAYKQLTGNGTIIAKITSQTTPSTNSIGGLMMRDSLAANANAFTIWEQSGVPRIQASQRVASVIRDSAQDSIGYDGGPGVITPPYWLKIVRNGSRFVASSSPDGVIWSPLNNQGIGGDIPMGSTIYVGLVVCSASANSLSTSTFTNVAIDTAGGSYQDGTYRIVNRGSGKVLDVTGSQDADNSPIIQYSYGTGLNQLWRLTDLGSGKYRVIGVDSNKALTVPGSSTADGTGIVLWTYNPTANNQRWFMTATDSGFNSVKVERASKAMQVRSSDNTTIEQGTYSGLTSQQWSFQAP